MKRLSFLLVLALVACSGSEQAVGPPSSTNADAGEVDSGLAPPADASADAGPALTGECAKTFGTSLTEGFGRIDGVVYALQMPNDQSCTMPNRDHLIVQVRMNGAVYRMVVNVESDRAGQDPRVRLGTVQKPLPPPAFAEGWHTGVAVDYPTTLGAHSGSFTPYVMDDLVAKVTAELKVGDPVSVYATSGAGRPESAHLVHRNRAGANVDGLIVVRPDGATPKMLLFAFDGQTF